MATKLKDIAFGDDLLKGSANSNSGVDYPFGTQDRIVEDNGSSSPSALMEYSGSDGWRFYGTADTANRLAYGSEGWIAGCSSALAWYDGVGSTTVISGGSGEFYFSGKADYACAISDGSATWTPSYSNGDWSLNGYACGIDIGTGSTWSPGYDSGFGCWSLNGYACGIDGGGGSTWSPYYDSDHDCWTLNGYACGITDGSATWSPSYNSMSGDWVLPGYACYAVCAESVYDSEHETSWSPSYENNVWNLNGYANGILDADGGSYTWQAEYDSSSGFWEPCYETPLLATGIGDGVEGYLKLATSSGWISLDGYYGDSNYTIIEGNISGGSSTPQFRAPSLAVKYIAAGPQGSESFYELSVDNGFVKATLVS